MLWMLALAAMLPHYPDAPRWLVLVSLLYPVFYVLLSVHLARSPRPIANG